MRSFLVLSMALLLTACASTKQYEGAERPDSELATLTFSEEADVGIVIINENGSTAMGLGFGGGFIKEFKLLPGQNSVTASYNPPKNLDGPNAIQCDLSFAEVEFQAEANTRYEIQYTVRSRDWDVWVQDVSNDKMANEKRTYPLKILDSSGTN